MINFIKTYIWLFIPLFLLGGFKTDLTIDKKNQHKISINHPGEKGPVNIILHQVLDENDIPVQYYMDVTSVICLEEVCKVIPVRLFWNNLGEYQKYELEKGATLEKYEDDLFDKEDYPKLHTILANSDSPFKEVYIDEILKVVDEHDEESDAVSGATALELDEKDTVPGAALTCYTLWHWANGEIVQKIKNITGKVLSENQLKRALKDNNRAYFEIGIKELENRKNFSNSFVDIIVREVLIDETLCKSTFAYLEKASSKTYFEATKQIFTKGGKGQKLAAIRSLQYSKHQPSTKYLDVLSDEILSMKSFQEVSFFLNLMQTKNPKSKKVTNNVFDLLTSDFIIARRAYWFLKNQETTASQEEKLNQFYKKHKNSL